MKESMKITEEVTKTVTVNLTRADVVSLLKDKYSAEELARAEVFMNVPGGADWSNEELEIENSDGGLIVRFTTITKTSEER